MMNSSQLDALATNHLATSAAKKTQQKSLLLAYRFMIFYRFILALLGGYVLASLSAVVIAQSFAESRASAAMSATLVAFTLWACAFIWVFIVNKTLKASLGIILPSIFLFVIYKFLGN